MCSSLHLQSNWGYNNRMLKTSTWRLKISAISGDSNIYVCMEECRWKDDNWERQEGTEAKCKKNLLLQKKEKRGHDGSVFVQRLLYALCHLCSISKSTHSSHLSLWPWTLAEHSSFSSTWVEGCSDDWLHSLSLLWTLCLLCGCDSIIS